jgi:DNA processing protein
MSYITISLEDPNYPRLLKEISSPPQRLFVQGKIYSDEACIAIVGTRKPTSYGIEAAKYFTRALVQAGYTIVSGLAFGIDKVSHEECIDAGGRTIAVLASGIDKITPRTNEPLAKAILEKGGAIISEFPPGEEALPERFPRRNRIISGLSIAVVVIEAPEKSGALITAKFAANYGREVFVVPGSIFSPNFEGSHMLIKEGASLVTRPEDIIESLGNQPLFVAPRKMDLNSEMEEKILNYIRENNGISIEELAEKTNIPIKDLNAHLTFLEIKRYIRKENDRIFINK